MSLETSSLLLEQTTNLQIMFIGYARVSTESQNLELQIDALKKAGCEKIYSEKISGAKTEREEYEGMKKYLRPNQDIVVVYKLDRLGRSLKHLMEEIEWFKQNNIGFKSIQENIDTSSSSGKLFFHMFAAIAEFERDLIRERTMAGLLAARARGRKGGRKPKVLENQVKIIQKLHEDKDTDIKQICYMFKISKSVLYRTLKKAA
jgi:DNA invertase Pin-like site-specific DNA recombinase